MPLVVMFDKSNYDIVIDRERSRGLEICDRRNEWRLRRFATRARFQCDKCFAASKSHLRE